jgi:restriction endonuclease S subunit
MLLKDAYQISSGYTFREAIEGYAPGKVGVVQAGDINEGRLASITRIAFDGERHLLKVGDIVLSARGKSIARTVSADILPAVAASSVFVLRPATSAVQSKFVARYLNSQTGQAGLAKLASGAYIKTLRKQELAQLVIPLPPPNTQRTIIQLVEAIEAQTALLTQKQLLLNTIWNSAVLTIAKGTQS